MTSYDDVLYPSYTHPQTHPDRLATIGTLMGMKPAPITQCRILELGCGDGGNLIPMAFGLPHSEFMGIDLAERPVQTGRGMITDLGLRNIHLKSMSLMEITPDGGLFDYIIAHGIYSWVPPEVRQKLLQICHDNLAPNGIAYVSYNTYPGNHLRNMVREMMLFHVQGIQDPQEKVQRALALVRFLAESQSDPDSYRRFLREELEEILDDQEGQLYHDELAPINVPEYFHEFVAHAGRHQLQYLAEADYFEMQDRVYTPQTSQILRQLSPSRIVREQYLDFLKCRRFRQTLLCHQDIPLDLPPKADLVMNCYLASLAKPEAKTPDLPSRTIEKFVGRKGAAMATDFPLAKAAMLLLGERWPQPMHFSELLEQARRRIDAPGPGDEAARKEDAESLAHILLQTYANGLVELHLYPPPCAATPGPRPKASPVARWQVARGCTVTTLRHGSILISDVLGQHLLQLLDGTRDREALLAEMRHFITAQRSANASAGDREKILPSLESELDRNLAKLARLGLLIA